MEVGFRFICGPAHPHNGAPISAAATRSGAQRNVPDIKIMARAHLDADLKNLTDMKIHKIVQPEFEGALAIVKNILTSRGESKEEVAKKMKTLRLSHSSI